MRWRDGSIEGVEVATLHRYRDDRGYLFELFRDDELSVSPVMGYYSATRSGVTRGPHEHARQTDVFIFLPSFELYLWDARPSSPTYRVRQKFRFDQGATRVVVPPGVVHAYKCVCEEGQLGVAFNFPDVLYAGEGRKGPVDETRHEEDPQTVYAPW